MKIGFIGTVLMGNPMAENLLKKFKVNIHNRTKEKTNNLIELGADWKDSPKDICKSSDIVIIMVSDDNACEDVFFKQNGILSNMNKGIIIINMSTITPEMSIKLSKEV
ncbi:MAG: NAD(P)-dependent oxidoreductase, partial [Candidatus Hodarchaeales archaeon]